MNITQLEGGYRIDCPCGEANFYWCLEDGQDWNLFDPVPTELEIHKIEFLEAKGKWREAAIAFFRLLGWRFRERIYCPGCWVADTGQKQDMFAP